MQVFLIAVSNADGIAWEFNSNTYNGIWRSPIIVPSVTQLSFSRYSAITPILTACLLACFKLRNKRPLLFLLVAPCKTIFYAYIFVSKWFKTTGSYETATFQRINKTNDKLCTLCFKTILAYSVTWWINILPHSEDNKGQRRSANFPNPLGFWIHQFGIMAHYLCYKLAE